MSINENLLNEKINQLKKGLEIIGADKKLYSKSNSDIINNILEMAFNGDSIKFTIENSDYTIDELIKCKQAYEKHFLKNKSTTLNSIVYKITRGLEEYNKIYAGINRTYRLDINKLLLSSIVNIENISDLDEQEQYYGDYLNQKRKQIIDGVVSKVGIV